MQGIRDANRIRIIMQAGTRLNREGVLFYLLKRGLTVVSTRLDCTFM
jgi:hypothetical protein